MLDRTPDLDSSRAGRAGPLNGSAFDRTVRGEASGSEPGRLAPEINLPKGGGALRSIDEKFSVNAANGTCDLTIPLPFSRTRSGFDGAVVLHYSSGAGNGPFGLGWSLSLPSIQRRTDKQLPQYNDTDASDVFLLAGGEDLVPAFARDSAGAWARDEISDGNVHAERYRPRVEGQFARIEKISVDGEVGCFWRVTTRQNVVTVFGRTANARVADPKDGSRIFRWLPEWSYDATGNCVQYTYKPEDLNGVPETVEEKNRLSGLASFANRYLKQISYGNTDPYYPDAARPLDPPPPANAGYCFAAVFDYGEHDDDAPTPTATPNVWPCRFDSFSDCRARFEMRTYRLCRRVLFFHFFAELDPVPAAQPSPYLVRSVDLGYRHFLFDGAAHRMEESDFIVNVRTASYRRTAVGTYDRKELPALDLTYHDLRWSGAVNDVQPEDVANAPAGVASTYQWTDFYGIGVPGILTEQATGWYYKRNLGDGHFGRAERIMSKPSLAGVATGALQLQDLDADGSRQLVSRAEGLRGYFELDDNDDWQPFRAFERTPNTYLDDPFSRQLDLDGDGRPDFLTSEENAFRWYPSLGRRGYDEPRLAPKALDEERGPAIVFADGTQTIFLADMNGDGLGDIVRIRSDEVCYWPNLGYGDFGAKVTMANPPRFDFQDHFDPTAVRLADVSGTGAADILYTGRGGVTAWINLAGNGWSDPQPIEPFPSTEPPNRIWVFDLLGNGTASLVWSSELPGNASSPLRYIDLMGGRKPYILSGYRNNLGAETQIEYRSSTHYALLDAAEGRPWVTKLPFPTMCVSRTEVRDAIRESLFVHEYRYRHGYYDHAEREFRGFGMVETVDTESFDRFRGSAAGNVLDASVHQPPVRRRTWYHTGAFINGANILGQFQSDYYQNTLAPETPLPDASIDTSVITRAPNPEELRQAARVCKTVLLREEVYADDESPVEAEPYSTAEHCCHVRMLQPILPDTRYAVFLVHEGEAVTYHYERNAADPRITHELTAAIDEFGNVLESASVAYGRRTPDLTLPAAVQVEQALIRATYTVRSFTDDIDTSAAYRVRMLCEERAYELTGASPAGALFTPGEIRTAFIAASPLEYEDAPTPGFVERRLLRHHRTLYARDADVNAPLDLGLLGSHGLVYEDYRLALTSSLAQSLYSARVTAASLDAMLLEGDYIRGDDFTAGGLFPASDPAGLWWVPSGTVRYPPNPEQNFYLPDRYVDPHGSATTVRYFGNYNLLIDRVEDALGNATLVTAFEFRVLQPQSIQDINDNITEVSFDLLGLVVGTAVRGKGAEADDLAGFVPDLSPAQTAAFFADPVAAGPGLIQHATSRFVYDYQALPAYAASITRETHYQAALAAGQPSKLQYAFEYSDGLGRVAMRKIQAEPGVAKQCAVQADGTFAVTEIDTTPDRRWVGSGRVVVNNKGNPVMEYEPYFSVTHQYEDAEELVASGVTPVLFYDPLDRLLRTDFPDGSFSSVTFGPWAQRTYDRNDNVLASDWYASRAAGALGPAEQDAAQKTALHDSTAASAHSDSIGRTVFEVEHNRFRDRMTAAVRNEFYGTRRVVDIDGNPRALYDARGNAVMTYDYDMLGRACHTESMDAGERWRLGDAIGKALYGWDSKANQFRTRYDALHRPTQHEVLTLPAAAGATPLVYEKSEYGTDRARNENGKLVRQYDGAGRIDNGPYDFNGNRLATERTFLLNAGVTPDWRTPAAIPLQGTSWTTTTEYDALGRVTAVTAPDGSVTTTRYGESNLIAGVDVEIAGSPVAPFLRKVEHNALGQRTRIEYAIRSSSGSYTSGLVTRFDYDELTFRVQRIRTLRSKDGVALQDLNYTYDPSGNVTRVRDLAQQTIYFNNQHVSPDNDFTYDAAYRIVVALGREHVGQNMAVDRFDGHRSGLAHPAEGNAMQNYRQEYEYDYAGNLTTMVHSSGVGPFLQQWTRLFFPDATDNRLASSQVGATAEPYTYDAHGNLTSLPSVSSMTWDFDDELRSVDLGGGGTAVYAYDADRSRVRKVSDDGAGLLTERLYLGAFEAFFETHGGGTDLRRDTLHVMDGAQRMALIDRRVEGDDGTPELLIRYQLTNHLGTSLLEVDDLAQIISYEEYYPFGSTSFQSVDASREVPAKRYRFTGKERDEETGFYYHGARYYAPWLARWTAPDRGDLKDGLNRYAYVRNCPVRLFDPSGHSGQEGGWWQRHGPRVVGGLQVLGGVLEIAAGVVGMAAPTGVTQVLGGIAIVHGADTLTTGLHSLISGRVQETLTQQAAAGTARALGASETTAHRIGVGVDFVAGVVPSVGIGIARTAATRTAVEGTSQTLAHTAPEAAAHTAPSAAAQTGTEAATHAAPEAAAHAAPEAAGHAAPEVATGATGRAVAGAGGRAGARALTPAAESALRVRIVGALEQAIGQQNRRLAQAIATRDVAFLRNLGLSQGQIAQLFTRQGFARVYGQAMELALNRAIGRSPFLSQFFEHIGSRAGAAVPRALGRPDWMGRGVMQGMIVDLTTWAGRAAHYARPYGHGMLTLGYERLLTFRQMLALAR